MSRATRKRKSLLFWSNNGTGLAHNWTSMLFLLHLSSSSLTQAWGYDLFREKMAECLTEHWLTKAPNNGHNIFTVPACMQISKGGDLRNSPKLFVWPDYRMYVGRVVEGGRTAAKVPPNPPSHPSSLFPCIHSLHHFSFPPPSFDASWAVKDDAIDTFPVHPAPFPLPLRGDPIPFLHQLSLIWAI